jgi:aryl-alcohol dehydrogenase-like predicted oxidoreductase
MTKAQTFPQNDHRNYNRDGQHFNVGETFAGLPFEKGVELAEALKPLLPAGMTMADMAQRWILDHDAVSTVITGASKPEQARANAQVSALPRLSADLHLRLAEFYDQRVKTNIRGPN